LPDLFVFLFVFLILTCFSVLIQLNQELAKMHIIVCIKRVPSTETKVRVGKDGKTLDPSGVEYLLNPYDEFAVEEALRVKEKKGEGEVTVVCLGPGEATKELRTALAMGADKAVHLKDEIPDRDAWSTAKILADYLKTVENKDLIFFGRQGIDFDQTQVGQRVATLLGWSCVTAAIKLEVQEDKIIAEREIEGGREVVEAKLPAVITAQKGLNEPRYASLKGIMQAKRKPLEEAQYNDPGKAIIIDKMELPPERPPGKILGEGVEAVPLLLEKLKNEAKII